MRLLFILIAVGLVIYGVVSSTLLWVLAGACAIALLRRGQSGITMDEDAQRFGKVIQRGLGPLWRQLLLVSLLCTTIAGWTANKSDFILLGVVFWLVALGLLLSAGFVHDYRTASPRVAKAADAESVSSTAIPMSAGQGRWTRVDWGTVMVLTLLAFGLRIYQLGATLPPFHGDEGEMGMLALLALHGPDAGLASQPLLPFSTAFLGHPTLFHYLQAFGMRLFGETIVGLRLVSVIFGTLCAPLLYAIGRAYWGRVAGLTAGWLLAVAHLQLQFSRIALNNIETVLSMILLIWLFTLADVASRGRRGRRSDGGDGDEQAPLLLYIVIGLVVGLGQYFYFGARLLPLVAALLLLVMWRNQQIRGAQVAVVVIAAGVAYFPLLVHYVTHWRAFSDRINGVGVFSPLGMAHALGPQATWPNDIPLLLWTQIRLNLSFFLDYGDRSAFYTADLPAFDKITVILFWLGLGLVGVKANRLPELMIIAWFSLGVVLGGVLTNDAPYAPRLIVAVPAFLLIGGIFLQAVANALRRIWPIRGRQGGLALVLVMALGTLYFNFNTYFIEYKQHQPSAAHLDIAQEMAAEAEDASSYLMGAPNLYVEYGTIRFIARAAERHDLEDAAQLQMELEQRYSDKDILIFALPHRVDDLAEIERQLPLGTRTTHLDQHDVPLYITYRIAAADMPQAFSP